MARTRKRAKFIHEGKYAAEVPIELIEDDTAWSPYLSPEDVHKLDTVRLALLAGPADGSPASVFFEAPSASWIRAVFR